MIVKIKQYVISAKDANGDRLFLCKDNKWSPHLSEAELHDSLIYAHRYCSCVEHLYSTTHSEFQIHDIDITMESYLKNIRNKEIK